ncbi:hypothetical protein PRIPAC_76110, partial [Pristionchus pacificus]|uniref:Acetyltransferase n=1 Tax=Pristionchus pacificus TaxID=54126 RepID=A0A2A6CFC4_PRIPA
MSTPLSSSSFIIEELKDEHTLEVLAMLDDPSPSIYNYFSVSAMMTDVDLVPYGLRDASTGRLLAVLVVSPWASAYLCKELRDVPDIRQLLRYYEKVAYIALLWVRDGHRRMGYARHLITHAINEMRDLPTAEPRLLFALVPSLNTAAVGAFHRMGFGCYATIPRVPGHQAAHTWFNET